MGTLYSNGNHILRLKTINEIDGNDWDVTVTYLLNFTTFTEGTWEIIETLAEYEYGSNLNRLSKPLTDILQKVLADLQQTKLATNFFLYD